ncbi:hypothetical protein [Halococcoides cellulosivorans]|uniref:DUF4829 domain-containing protein n=1 Tax=Halococcoides cellulosivorans TaxID=1679096 RepID=A0A2R4X3T8_9EURY|nr:hypothetical protein [Halococcoides cellulosivorans]AWB28465.1 hypothetical protein HARCEL1_12515 [Halococcoides cellulosivorans]
MAEDWDATEYDLDYDLLDNPEGYPAEGVEIDDERFEALANHLEDEYGHPGKRHFRVEDLEYIEPDVYAVSFSVIGGGATVPGTAWAAIAVWEDTAGEWTLEDVEKLYANSFH